MELLPNILMNHYILVADSIWIWVGLEILWIWESRRISLLEKA